MNRTRIMLGTYIDLDPVPGAFHTAENARSHVNRMLKDMVPHYSPVVGIISYGRQFYTIEFNHHNRNWHGNPEYNQMFVRATLAHMSDLATARGYLFLNEVYEALGVDKTREGQIVGWTDGPISWDWDSDILDVRKPINIRFHTEGCIIDKAFEEDSSHDYVKEDEA